MWGVGPKVHVVRNGIPLLPFLSRDEARGALNITTPHPVVGTIAELTHNKNIGGVIDALAHLRTPIEYVVIGGGELYEKITEKADSLRPSSVRLLGFKADAYQYIRAFDLFLLPSFKEGVPYVILEAQAAGVPIAASDVGGIPEILTTYPHTLFDPTNTESITQAINNGLLLHKPEPTHTYTIERMCAETLQVYGA
jgi:glycosyltransferase involved in cell wall biosynthesis